jgi:hypothetical protein
MDRASDFTARIYDWAHRFVQTLSNIVFDQTKHNTLTRNIFEVVLDNFSDLIAANNS